MVLRRYTFKLYPTKTQDAALRDQARLCAVLWNALLEMRETHYRRAKIAGAKKTSLSAFDQGKDITALNAAAKTDPALAEWWIIPRGTQERVADMLDLAMKAFFKRAKGGAGAQSGYPRYKSTRHAENIPLREPVKSCWKFEPSAHSAPARKGEPRAQRKEECNPATASRKKNPASRARKEEGAQRLQTPRAWCFTLRGIPGRIKARGKFPVAPAAMKTADVKFYDDAWWISICAEIERERKAGSQNLTVEFDLIDRFAGVKTADGRCAPGLSDPFPSGREGEFPSKEGGSQEASCGEPSVEGKTQARLRVRAPAPACGEPSVEGKTQEQFTVRVGTLSCGEPSVEGETQESQGPFRALLPCGEPSVEGETQDTRSPARNGASCDESSTEGKTQVERRLADAIQSAGDRRYKRGSIRWRRERARVARLRAKQARRTKEALHRWTTDVVAQAKELCVIKPPVKDSTRSGRGNEKFPGAQVGTIAALNRNVLSMAPASAVQMLEYKAKEAGVSCVVETKDDHQIRIGGGLRSAAIADRRAKRVVKKAERKVA